MLLINKIYGTYTLSTYSDTFRKIVTKEYPIKFGVKESSTNNEVSMTIQEIYHKVKSGISFKDVEINSDKFIITPIIDNKRYEYRYNIIPPYEDVLRKNFCNMSMTQFHISKISGTGYKAIAISNRGSCMLILDIIDKIIQEKMFVPNLKKIKNWEGFNNCFPPNESFYPLRHATFEEIKIAEYISYKDILYTKKQYEKIAKSTPSITSFYKQMLCDNGVILITKKEE